MSDSPSPRSQILRLLRTSLYADERDLRTWGFGPEQCRSLVLKIHRLSETQIASIVAWLDFGPHEEGVPEALRIDDGVERVHQLPAPPAGYQPPQVKRAAEWARREAERRNADERARRVNKESLQRLEAARQEARERARRAEEEPRRQQDTERLAEEARLAARKEAITRFGRLLESDFLAADQTLASSPDAGLLTHEEIDDLKAHFVRDWALRELGQRLDLEQAAAAAASDGDIQVVARAGSGKTRTLVTRATFLQKHCRVDPSELLLLAFNTKAAEEMKARLAGVLGGDLPHVMTFHALAHALVHPVERLLYDDLSADQMGLSREVQEVVGEHVRSAEHGGRIRQLMLSHFRQNREPAPGHGEMETSLGKQIIANALLEHGIEHIYDADRRWDGINYRSDFMIRGGSRDSGVIIDYIDRRGAPDSDETLRAKREYRASRPEWKFLEFSPRELARDGEQLFVEELLRQLGSAGITCERLTEDELWERVRRRAVDDFTRAMVGFVRRCRAANLSPNRLAAMVGGHDAASEAEEQFLSVAVSVYASYLQRLASRSHEDFDGLMWRATALVREGQTRFVRDSGRERGDVARLRYVLIDEFQDFSQMFFELIGAIRSVNPGMQLFCVGDDWQAINAYAGSDLKFFEQFDNLFRETSIRYVRTNYRSPRSVVGVGNAVMVGLGAPALTSRSDAGQVWMCRVDQFFPSAREADVHGFDAVTPAVLRLCRSLLDRGLDVVMLARRDGLSWPDVGGQQNPRAAQSLDGFLKHVREFLPPDDRERVTVSTAHRYKGLEQSAVIVLDAVDRSFPLVHPNWVFLRVFGDSVAKTVEDERRLFYVALTRASDSLVILTETGRESRFLEDVLTTEVSWKKLAPVASLDAAWLEVRVREAYDVKDLLRSLSYRYHPADRSWRKAVTAAAFSLQALKAQSWARPGIRIKVYTETGKLLHDVTA